MVWILFIGAVIFFVGQTGADSTDELIDQMITDYGNEQEAASKQIEKNLAKLQEQDAELVAGVGFYTGEKSYESFELQAKGVRSVVENCTGRTH